MDRIRLVGQTTQWPRLKKMYLILVLSTVCIFFFQFHISRAQLDSVAPEVALDQLAPHHQEPMRELLLAEPSGVIQSTASGVDESEVIRFRGIKSVALANRFTPPFTCPE